VGTLLVVLLITSLKELGEDLQRGKSDKYENTRIVKVVTFDANGNPIETEKQSKFVCPGDIVKLEGTMPSPVDLLLILTSIHADGNKCYIETANIDGETNLKVREAPPALYDAFGPIIQEGRVCPELFKGSLNFEAPNKNIHNFVGTLKLDASAEPIPLGAGNVVLRSALFSNTDWGYGIAIYTGQETKIQMNNRNAPSKMSKIEENLNKAIIIIFVAQIILVTISVISIYLMGFESEGKLPYVFPPGTARASELPLWLEQWYASIVTCRCIVLYLMFLTCEHTGSCSFCCTTTSSPSPSTSRSSWSTSARPS
jgi:phospholipid-transporting ATPase